MSFSVPPEEVEIIGIVVNEKGAERAIATGAVQTLGFPYSISPEFLQRNQTSDARSNRWMTLEAVIALAHDAGLDVVAYLSMAFGNPYGDAWSVDEVARRVRTADSIAGCGRFRSPIRWGWRRLRRLRRRWPQCSAPHGEIEIGVHLHARREEAAAHIRAAFEAGCRRFDAAIGGLGGCPFAQDASGRATFRRRVLMAVLTQCGASLPRLGTSR